MDKQFFGGENWPQLELNSYTSKIGKELDLIESQLEELYQRRNELLICFDMINNDDGDDAIWAEIERIF